MRAVDQRLERREIDLDDPVVGGAVIGSQVSGNCISCFGDVCAAGGAKVLGHVRVVAEDRTCGANFCTHVADGRLTGCRDRIGTRTEVFDDCSCAAFDSEHSRNFEDHVFRARPSGEFADESNADHFRPAHVEWKARHHVHCIGSTDSDCDHAKSTRIGCVAVGADHHSARERVVLEHDLVDDSAARAPETNAVLSGHTAEKVVHLFVRVDSDAEIDLGARLGENQVVAMHGARHCGRLQPSGHELEESHLGCGVLHRHSIRIEVGVTLAPFHLLGARLAEVIDQHLLGQRERAT